MANRLTSMNHHTSEYGLNLLQNYYKHRPLADIENEFNIYIEDDPFEYKKIINRPETTTTMYKSDNEDDELIKRAIRSAPLQRSNRKHKKKNETKFDSKSDQLNKKNRSVDSIKKGVKNRKRCKSTIIDSTSKEDSDFGFLVLSMDEVGYSRRKKQLNDQIHDLMRKDSAQVSRLAKSNKDSTSEGQQWIPIVGDSSSAFKSNSSNTLIDTFTSVGKEKNNDNIYHVSSDIGSLIAQKLETGVKLYICRNGELVNSRPENRNTDSKDSNRAALEELLETMKVPLPTPLSWQDQILKSEGKMLRGPRKHEVKIVEKPIHERKLFVKKLIDEEEFRPKLKQELEKQFLIAQTTKPKVNPFIVNTTHSNIKTKNAKVTSVEIVGVKQKFKPANASLTIDEESEEIMNEKQYNQIIENLTKQYATRKKIQIDSKLTAKEQKELSDQEYVTDLINKYPPPPPPPTTTAKERQTNPPPPPPSTSNCTTPIRVNLHSLANDYVMSNENSNRKKQTNFNVNKAYTQIYAQNTNPKPSILKSRPNSPNTSLSIILTKKNSNNDLTSEKTSAITKHTTNQSQPATISRSNTQGSIVKINPISNAIKTAKSKTNRDNSTVEPMFIHISSSLEPTIKPDYIQYQTVRQYHDPYDRKNSSLHNPSMVNSSFNDTPFHSRLY